MRVISSFLHNRRHKALHKPLNAKDTKVNLQHNKLIHLEDSMVMNGVYNAETLEKINTVYQIHHITTPNERLFAGELNTAFTWYVKKNGVYPLCYKFAFISKNIKKKICKNV